MQGWRQAVVRMWLPYKQRQAGKQAGKQAAACHARLWPTCQQTWFQPGWACYCANACRLLRGLELFCWWHWQACCTCCMFKAHVRQGGWAPATDNSSRRSFLQLPVLPVRLRLLLPLPPIAARPQVLMPCKSAGRMQTASSLNGLGGFVTGTVT